jgi:ribosomal protein S12 methylthiotransferase
MKKKLAKSVGFVSLGCSKALVDSEKLINSLTSDGVNIVDSFEEADVVVVNTCGFIDSAVSESLSAIKEAKKKNGKVLITGCLGAKRDVNGSLFLNKEKIGALDITGPNEIEETSVLLKRHLGIVKNTVQTKKTEIRLTPHHYAFIKISEGCDQKCTFCIIPSMRGRLVSRSITDVLDEAKRLVKSGVRELIVISQDSGAYGRDLRYKTEFINGVPIKSNIIGLIQELKKLKVWIRVHYLYPYPSVDNIVPMMADRNSVNEVISSKNGIVPYIDMPFQHAHPEILKKMRRPGKSEKIIERIKKWRNICENLTIRSTFIVGFPGETEEHFCYLLDFLKEVKLDRVGCFSYSDVLGAEANQLSNPVPEEIKEERKRILLSEQANISENRLERWKGKLVEVIIEGVDQDAGILIGRGPGDSPDIDGIVEISSKGESVHKVEIGNFSLVRIVGNNEHDLISEFVS